MMTPSPFSRSSPFVLFSLCFFLLISLLSLPSIFSASSCSCSCPSGIPCNPNCLQCAETQSNCQCNTPCTTDNCAAGYQQISSCGFSCCAFFGGQSKKTCLRQCSFPNGQCLKCLPQHYGPNCIKCSACSGRGICNDGRYGDGRCICYSSDFNGNECQYSRMNDCNNRGKPNFFGTPCICDPGFAGDRCERCAPDYYGPLCRFCKSSSTCNNNGICSTTDGNCKCDNGFTGSQCEVPIPTTTTTTTPTPTTATVDTTTTAEATTTTVDITTTDDSTSTTTTPAPTN